MAFRNVSNALIHKCKIAQDIEHAMYPLVHKTLTSLRMASNEIRFLLFQESCEFLFIIRTLIPVEMFIRSPVLTLCSLSQAQHTDLPNMFTIGVCNFAEKVLWVTRTSGVKSMIVKSLTELLFLLHGLNNSLTFKR